MNDFSNESISENLRLISGFGVEFAELKTVQPGWHVASGMLTYPGLSHFPEVFRKVSVLFLNIGKGSPLIRFINSSEPFVRKLEFNLSNTDEIPDYSELKAITESTYFQHTDGRIYELSR